MINVYDDEKNIITRVNYNDDLDFWDGRNFSCGSTGRHKGLTKLRNGKYVLIHGTDWQGEKDYGEIISKEQALQEILKSNNTSLLNEKKFSELNKLYDAMMDSEMSEDD